MCTGPQEGAAPARLPARARGMSARCTHADLLHRWAGGAPLQRARSSEHVRALVRASPRADAHYETEAWGVSKAPPPLGAAHSPYERRLIANEMRQGVAPWLTERQTPDLMRSLRAEAWGV